MLFEEAIELEHPIVLLEPLAFLLNRLLEQLCARLGSRALPRRNCASRSISKLSRHSINNQKATITNSFALCVFLFPCSTPKFFSNFCNSI